MKGGIALKMIQSTYYSHFTEPVFHFPWENNIENVLGIGKVILLFNLPLCQKYISKSIVGGKGTIASQ